ncbi:hypothetical protein HOY82DRAFT_536368 [Tuber indicum]|nr:hypothetical protein HOY82DRAFT_536368 [Tuber indicum]
MFHTAPPATMANPATISDSEGSESASNVPEISSSIKLYHSHVNQIIHHISPGKNDAPGNNQNLACPFQHFPLQQHRLQEQELRWLECVQKLHQESEVKWLKRLDEKNKVVDAKCADIENLKVGSLLTIFAPFLTAVQVMVLNDMTERIKLRGAFNICGALERMVSQAIVIKKIDHVYSAYWYRIIPGLDKIAKTTEFITVLENEVAARGLSLKDVTTCISDTYSEVVTTYDEGNDNIVTLIAERYTPNQVAVLASFLRLQYMWPGGLDWIEEKEGNILAHHIKL